MCSDDSRRDNTVGSSIDQAHLALVIRENQDAPGRLVGGERDRTVAGNDTGIDRRHARGAMHGLAGGHARGAMHGVCRDESMKEDDYQKGHDQRPASLHSLRLSSGTSNSMAAGYAFLHLARKLYARRRASQIIRPNSTHGWCRMYSPAMPMLGRPRSVPDSVGWRRATSLQRTSAQTP